MTPPTTRPIERLAYLCYLAILVCSIGITWLGWIVGSVTGEYTAMCIAVAGLGVSRWLHVHGHAHWHFRECEDSFDVPGTPSIMPRSEDEEAQAVEFAALLEQFTAKNDVWAHGDLRRELARRLQAAPRLREEFAHLLAEHPDL